MGLDIYFHKVSEIGYFRKVNFLVAYFKSKGLDVDKQTPLVISRDMITELINKCNKVLSDHTVAKEELPTMEGFFFGSTDYDKYYYNNVESVRNYLQNELLPEFDNLDKDEYIEFDIWY